MDQSLPYVRPGFWMKDLVNPVVVRLGLAPILVVPGRRSGRERATPIGGPFTHDGRRYLVSGRGDTQWVRNLRAAGRGQLRTRGCIEWFKAIELTGPDRDEVVAAYRRTMGRSVDRLFRRIPNLADHPVFLMEPEPADA